MKGPRRSRFEAIFREGVRIKGSGVVLLALPGSGAVGVAVSRQVGCHARRNRLKRQVRAAAAQSPQVWTHMDAVLQVGPRTEALDFATLTREVQRLAQEVHTRWDAASESP